MATCPDDHLHNETCYRAHGCRCGDCRESQRVALKDYRDRKRGGSVISKGPAQHGTRSMYKRCTAGPDGGRCEPCKDANRAYQREYMRLSRAGIARTDPHVERALRR